MAFWALAAGSVVSGLLGANAAGKAADASADAANKAADVQRELGNRSLDLQKEQFDRSMDLIMPEVIAGRNNRNTLNYLLGTGGYPVYQDNAPRDPRAYTIKEVQRGGGGGTSSADIANTLRQAYGDMPFGGGMAFFGDAMNGNLRNRINTRGGGQTTWEVGGQSFGSEQEARDWVDRQQQAPVASGHQYEGYAPYTEFYGGLNREYDRGVKDLYDLDNFFASPDYQFRLDEGRKAMNKNFAGQGMRLSGAAAKAMNDYASGTASGEWGNYLTRGMWLVSDKYNRQSGQYTNYLNMLAGQAAQGSNATSQAMNAGQNYAGSSGNILGNMASGMGQAYQNAGDAIAGGIMGRNSAFQNAGQNIMQAYMLTNPEKFPGLGWGQ